MVLLCDLDPATDFRLESPSRAIGITYSLIGSRSWVIKRDRGRPAEFDSGRRQLPGAFGTDNTQTWLLVRLKGPEMPKGPQSGPVADDSR